MPIMPTGLYIHMPFCKSRCIYCDFYSQTERGVLQDVFVAALQRELSCRAVEADAIGSVYMGGGTPSLFSAHQIACILECVRTHYNITDGAEVTIEMNPDDVTAEYASALVEAGVNRISLGIQSFDDGVLRFLRRRHTAAQAMRAVDCLADAMGKRGSCNISIDLIYGLPGQRMEIWKQDVKTAFSLPITHLSSYALSYEENTPIHSMLEKGEIRETSDEDSLLMYQHIIECAKRHGFDHYEISNFSLPGFHSRHNSSYWEGVPYIGIGPGAHSYDGRNVRRLNVPSMKRYVEEKEVPCELEVLSADELFNEKIFTRLRTRKGLNLEELSEDDRAEVLKTAEQHMARGKMKLRNGWLSLTEDGIFTSDNILSDFMRV